MKTPDVPMRNIIIYRRPELGRDRNHFLMYLFSVSADTTVPGRSFEKFDSECDGMIPSKTCQSHIIGIIEYQKEAIGQ